MLVSQILKMKQSQDITILPPTAKVREATALLSEKRIGTVVVSSDGVRAEGILSERDVVRELGKWGPGCLEDTVQTLMTANPKTCTTNQKSEEVLQTMTEHRFRHLPVVDDAGKMIGIISIGDVVKARLAQLAMERDALEGMIMGN